MNMNERPVMINKIKKDNGHVYVLFVSFFFYVICVAIKAKQIKVLESRIVLVDLDGVCLFSNLCEGV